MELYNGEDSFTDYLDSEVRHDMYQRIANDLFDDWNDSNLNEGLLYADYRIAEASGDTDIIEEYHNHWQLEPGDEYYID